MPQFDNIYYFDGYDANETWEYGPENMTDNNTNTFASTYAYYPNHIQLCDNNSCTGPDLGTIITVKLRAFGKKLDAYRLVLRPVFNGTDGSNYPVDIRKFPDWSNWVDITNDPEAPDIWTWDNVKYLDCDVVAWQLSTPLEGRIYCGKVEIQVHYY